MDNVVVLRRGRARQPGLLGLYEGMPLTERGSGYGGHGHARPHHDLPAGRSARTCRTEDEVVDQVAHHRRPRGRPPLRHRRRPPPRARLGLDAPVACASWRTSPSPPSGADRPGIVAAVTGVLVEHGGNLEDTSMTILGGHFAMMLVVAVPDERRRRRRSRPRWPTATPTGPGRHRAADRRRRRRPPSTGDAVDARRCTAPTGPGSCTGSRTLLAERASTSSTSPPGSSATPHAGYVMLLELTVPAGRRRRRLQAALAALGDRARRRVQPAPGRSRRPLSRDRGSSSCLIPVLCSAARRADRRASTTTSARWPPTCSTRCGAAPHCVGVAAPQIGVALRAFCVDVTGHRKARSCHGEVVLFNPEVVLAHGRESAGRAA